MRKGLVYSFVLLFATSFLSVVSKAQESGRISGKVVDMADSLALSGLKGASVQLLLLPDTALFKNVVTGADGSFIFSGLPIADYLLRISFSGYVSAEKK